MSVSRHFAALVAAVIASFVTYFALSLLHQQLSLPHDPFIVAAVFILVGFVGVFAATMVSTPAVRRIYPWIYTLLGGGFYYLLNALAFRFAMKVDRWPRLSDPFLGYLLIGGFLCSACFLIERRKT